MDYFSIYKIVAKSYINLKKIWIKNRKTKKNAENSNHKNTANCHKWQSALKNWIQKEIFQFLRNDKIDKKAWIIDIYDVQKLTAAQINYYINHKSNLFLFLCFFEKHYFMYKNSKIKNNKKYLCLKSSRHWNYIQGLVSLKY